MDYICFNRFKQKALCGEVNIPYGTKLEEANNIISIAALEEALNIVGVQTEETGVTTDETN